MSRFFCPPKTIVVESNVTFAMSMWFVHEKCFCFRPDRLKLTKQCYSSELLKRIQMSKSSERRGMCRAAWSSRCCLRTLRGIYKPAALPQLFPSNTPSWWLLSKNTASRTWLPSFKTYYLRCHVLSSANIQNMSNSDHVQPSASTEYQQEHPYELELTQALIQTKRRRALKGYLGLRSLRR